MASGTPNEPAESQTPPLLTAEDFRNADFEGPIRDLMKVDAYDLSVAYRQARAASEEGSIAHAVYALIEALCGIGLQPDDRASVWHPMFSNGPTRSSLPEDFRGEQSANLAEILAETKHPALKARLADIVWTNDRRVGAAAKLAVEGYCEAGEALLAGTMFGFGDESDLHLLEGVHIVHRALQIAYASSKRGQMPDRPKAILRAMYEAATTRKAYVQYVNLGELGLYYDILDPASIAPQAESLAASAEPDDYPMAAHGVWAFAARLYERMKDQDSRQRALKGAIEKTLSMRQTVKGSAAAEAHWVMDALQELRHVKGMEETEAALEIELRQLQKASLKEMGTFKYEIDVKAERAQIEAFFEACTLSDGFKEFALLDWSRDPDKLRKDALDGMDRLPLSSLFSAVHVDEHGRTTAKSSGATRDGEPDESWFTHEIGRAEHIRRVYTVAGRLHPARMILNARFGIGERHLAPIVQASPFIPQSQAALYALGLTRFFQGDFMSSTHLLLPQIEPCLRHILRQAGHDPATRYDDATEEDRSLSQIFEHMRSELEGLLGGDLAWEIDRLFNARPGPALRHEIAHGKLSGGACFSEDVYYANWLLYRVAVLPLIRHWAEVVEAGIAAEL